MNLSPHKGAFWASLRILGVSSGGSLKSRSAFSDFYPLERLGFNERIDEIRVLEMFLYTGA